MKRSHAIQAIALHLHANSEGDMGVEWWKIVAECVLDKTDELGMLPPRAELTLGSSGYKYTDNCWEPEDG